MKPLTVAPGWTIWNCRNFWNKIAVPSRSKQKEKTIPILRSAIIYKSISLMENIGIPATTSSRLRVLSSKANWRLLETKSSLRPKPIWSVSTKNSTFSSKKIQKVLHHLTQPSIYKDSNLGFPRKVISSLLNSWSELRTILILLPKKWLIAMGSTEKWFCPGLSYSRSAFSFWEFTI